VTENELGEERSKKRNKTPKETPKRQVEFEISLSIGSPGSARIGRCVSVRWASSAHLVSLVEFSNDSLWTHCKCFYSSASVDHSSHVCTGSEVCFAEDCFGWCSIQSEIVA
jgi:hypothetical protein